MSKEFSFSTRTNWQLNVNTLSTTLQSLKEKNIPIIDLTESNPTRCGLRYPVNKILAPLTDSQNMLYVPDARGSLEARAALSRYYQRKGFRVDPKRIFLTASTSEAYSYLFRLLLNSEECVLVGQPSYPLFEFLIELNDGKMNSFSLIYDQAQGSWQIDLKSLEKAIHSKTKAIVLVIPNNPTGSFVSPNELKAINQLCAQYNLALISDEVFNDYIFDENADRILSLVDNKDILSFSLSGLSKCLGLPQMKLGWIVVNGPQKLMDEALARLEVIADTYLSVNTPVQNALGRWFDVQEEILLEIRNRVRGNWEWLKQSVQNIGNEDFYCLNSHGGWYAILKLPSGRCSEEEWALEFLIQDHTFVHPGYFFDFVDEPFIVLSLLPETHIFEQGLKKIIEKIKA